MKDSTVSVSSPRENGNDQVPPEDSDVTDYAELAGRVYWAMEHGGDGAMLIKQEVDKVVARLGQCERAMMDVLRNPPAVTCGNFHHAKADQHTSWDCPCVDRWNATIANLNKLLST